MTRILDVKDLCVSYGAINAVKGITFHVDEGELVTLIGANGAGKTTTLRAISGLEKVKSGSIEFMGKDIVKLPSHDIVKEGIVHIPEGRRVFAGLTVKENLFLGANLIKDKNLIEEDYEKVYKIFPRLEERKNQLAGTLSGGEQQMLAFGRALMAHGKMILMDEPSMGLAPLVVEEIFRVIRQINDAGISVLLVEQNAFAALKTANRAYVLETGNITLEGESSSLLKDDSIRKAYLGN